jgi:predicted DNA-binding transcriptional regulator AlpA
MSDTTKKYYRAKEVAQYLSIGLSTCWLYAKEGKLTPIKLSPRVTVFDIDEINKLFNNVEVV